MTENYSVLMSVYHKEKPEYFRAAIESILNQTVKTNDFVIVCDGPLNEGLDNVITEVVTANPGLFNIYRMTENKGLAIALNNGILQCKNPVSYTHLDVYKRQGIISSGIEMITGEYSISAGASGAIFGIFGVLLVMIFKSRKQLGQVLSLIHI